MIHPRKQTANIARQMQNAELKKERRLTTRSVSPFFILHSSLSFL